MNTTPLHAPIVLAHGLFGFGRIGLGPLTFWAYFRGIPELLRSLGHRVLVTQVHPTAGIRRRAALLGDRINRSFPDQPVHIIGHSMGGLDARVLLTDDTWEDRILSLTTIATPHLGSTLADVARRQFGPIYRLLKTVGWDHEGFLDLIPERARRWHDAHPAPNVPCYSVAGDPTPDDVSWPLRRFYGLMSRWEGANDGLVSVESSLGFGSPLKPWPTDHFQQMNWYTGTRRRAVPPSIANAYLGIVENLRQHDRSALDPSMN